MIIKPEKVDKVSKVFTNFFMSLNMLKDEDNASFLEIFLGFVYAVKLISKAIEIAGILTPEEISKIDEQLFNVTNKTITKDKIKHLFEFVNGYKSEVSDVGSDE